MVASDSSHKMKTVFPVKNKTKKKLISSKATNKKKNDISVHKNNVCISSVNKDSANQKTKWLLPMQARESSLKCEVTVNRQ